MPRNGELIELAERKRLLLLEADAHRGTLRAELATVHARLGWLQTARNTMGAASPWFALGAGVLGILAARRWRNVLKWVPAALTALRWFQKLRAGGTS